MFISIHQYTISAVFSHYKIMNFTDSYFLSMILFLLLLTFLIFKIKHIWDNLRLMYFAVPRCEPLQWPRRGQVTYNKIIADQKYPLDTEAVYSCYDGYSLEFPGWTRRTCQESGNWTGQPNYCYRKYYSSITNWLHHVDYQMRAAVQC